MKRSVKPECDLVAVCRESIVTAGIWDWQEGRMQRTPLLGIPRAVAKPWPPRLSQVLVVVLGFEGLAY